MMPLNPAWTSVLLLAAAGAVDARAAAVRWIGARAPPAPPAAAAADVGASGGEGAAPGVRWTDLASDRASVPSSASVSRGRYRGRRKLGIVLPGSQCTKDHPCGPGNLGGRVGAPASEPDIAPDAATDAAATDAATETTTTAAPPTTVPPLRLGDDHATGQMNQEVRIPILANDDIYGTVEGSFSDPQNGVISEPTPDGLVYVPKLDWCGTDAFEYTVLRGDERETARVTVDVACPDATATTPAPTPGSTGASTTASSAASTSSSSADSTTASTSASTTASTADSTAASTPSSATASTTASTTSSTVQSTAANVPGAGDSGRPSANDPPARPYVPPGSKGGSKHPSNPLYVPGGGTYVIPFFAKSGKAKTQKIPFVPIAVKHDFTWPQFSSHSSDGHQWIIPSSHAASSADADSPEGQAEYDDDGDDVPRDNDEEGDDEEGEEEVQTEEALVEPESTIVLEVVDDSVKGPMNQAIDIPILVNDVVPEDVGGSFTTPEHGSIGEPNETGLTFHPEEDWCGTTSFEYTLMKGTAKGTATVTVEIECENESETEETAIQEDDEEVQTEEILVGPDSTPAPPAVVFEVKDDSVRGPMNQALEIPILVNDVVPEGVAGSFTTPEHGSLGAPTETGLTFHPEEDWCGTTSFQYTLMQGAAEGTATVTVDIECGAESESAAAEGIDVSGSDGSLATSTATPVPTPEPTSTPTPEPTPEATLTPTPEPPAASVMNGTETPTYMPTEFLKLEGDFAKGQMNQNLSVSVLLNDQYPDPVGGSFSDPQYGTILSYTSDGLIYAPDPDWCGIDSFDYTLFAGEESDTATVTIEIECESTNATTPSATNATLATPQVRSFDHFWDGGGDSDGVVVQESQEEGTGTFAKVAMGFGGALGATVLIAGLLLRARDRDEASKDKFDPINNWWQTILPTESTATLLRSHQSQNTASMESGEVSFGGEENSSATSFLFGEAASRKAAKIKRSQDTNRSSKMAPYSPSQFFSPRPLVVSKHSKKNERIDDVAIL
ncbi:hypothetical protein ACHAWF_015375 [Thalassiosira exigua]